MSGVLKLPRLGETMEEGRIVGWLVDEGAAFRRGDALVEVETDKTVVEVPALGAGRVVEHLVGEGETVGLGTPLARIEVEGADWTAEASGSAESNADPDSRPVGGVKDEATPPEVSAAVGGAERGTSEEAAAATDPANGSLAPDNHSASATAAGEQVFAVSNGASRPRATPLARRIARRTGVDLAEIKGTGRRGRIERRDVERAATSAGSGALHMRDDGPSSAPPILLLHGFAGDGSVWAGLSSHLVRAGYRTLAPDLPGHGQTRLPAEAPDALSAGLEPELAARVGPGPVHVIAHSLGAVPAVALAEQRQVASLTLIAPVGLGLEIDRTFISGLAHARSAGEVVHLLDRMVDGPLPLSDAAVADIHAALASGRLAALADAIVGPSGQAVSLRFRLATLAERVPVRLLLGHRDRIVPWQESLTVSPRISVHHFPQAGHVPHWETPTAVRDVILSGIARGMA